jgi:hypothetical protein
MRIGCISAPASIAGPRSVIDDNITLYDASSFFDRAHAY